MKTFLSILIFGIIITGCSSKNAFSKFDMLKEQELSVSNSQTSKITSLNSVHGVFSAVYLNEIDSKSFKDSEYFYISMYQKNKRELDISSVLLNGSMPISFKKLPNNNKFLNLTVSHNKWNNNYLVVFNRQNNKKLQLLFRDANLSSEILTYEKNVR